MGFFTSLTFYRPGRPPVITGEKLSQFIRQIVETGLVEESVLTGLKVKFGRSIDQDERSSFGFMRILPGVLRSREIVWDLSTSNADGFGGIINSVADNKSRIYRASVTIGSLVDAVRLPITREPCDMNSEGFYPDSLSISIGPVRPYVEDMTWHVGWLELSFNGNGYLFPWTLSEVVTRAIASPEIMKLCEIARFTWPVASRFPNFLEVRRRKRFARLWPYDDVRKPYDWYWSVEGMV
jgi:hypothetical protein